MWILPFPTAFVCVILDRGFDSGSMKATARYLVLISLAVSAFILIKFHRQFCSGESKKSADELEPFITLSEIFSPFETELHIEEFG